MTKKEKVLILSVGGTEKPLILAINSFEPDLVYFIHSKETEKTIEKILSELETLKYKTKLIENPQDLRESFDAAKSVLFELKNDKYDVHIDFTGGTKPMVAGLVLASINKECEYTYVGSLSVEGRDKDGVGVVKDGYESIKIQENPYELYAIKEFENAESFFNLHQFGAAYQNFNEAENKSGDKNLKDLANFYKKLVKFYDTWDKFENKLDNIILPKYYRENLLNDLEDKPYIQKEFESNLEFYNQFNRNIEFLNLKISHKNKNIKENIKFYLPDLLNNACRRIEEGKYDDAVARLYRSIELIGQLGLHELGIIDEERLRINQVFNINREDFENKADSISYDILQEVEYWPEYNSFPEKKVFKIPLKKTYTLLDLFGEEYADEYLNDKKLKGLVNKRNDSILAHGLIPIDKKNAMDLYKKVLKYSRELYPDIDDLIELSKFPKFN